MKFRLFEKPDTKCISNLTEFQYFYATEIRLLCSYLKQGAIGRGGVQHARLLLQQSEFESRWSLQFFCKFVFEKNVNKQKEAGVRPFFKKR